MQDIIKPFPFHELETKPPLSGRVKISDDLQQTLATIAGWNGSSRTLLKANQQGILWTTAPVVAGIVNVTGVGANDDWQGTNIEVSEVLIMANPDNTGRCWININAAAVADTGLPLDPGDFVKLSIYNLLHLQIRTVTAGDKFIVVYTV